MAAAEQLITANLDIWSSAIKTKSAAGRGKANKLELYGIKKLRELILELAVRGLLVSQDPNDEPASELLKKIAAEKAQLVKDGKIKKQKDLPEIEDEEKPFDLPVGWDWARLGGFVYPEMGQSPPSKFYNQDGDGLPFFQGKADFGDKFPVPRYWCVQPTKFAYPNDILLSVRAPVGPTNISNIECCIGRGLAALRPLSGVHSNFVDYLLKAFRPTLESFATGTTFVAVSKTVVEGLVITVPPLLEQNRIVAKVDELMALCDQLEQQQETSITAHQTLVQTLLDALTTASERDGFTAAWARIADHFDTLFTTEWSIDQLKQTILQLAVIGKLVPQDPNDEPASELLKKIAAEKAKLVKEGKIRKQKALPPIEENEKPFELPSGWEWARLNEMVTQLGDGLHGTPQYDDRGTYFFVNGNNLRDGEIVIKPETKRVNEQEFQKYQKNLIDRTVLVSINGTLGNVGFYDNEPVVLGKSACYFNLGAELSRLFIKRLIESPYYLGYAFENATGSTIKNLGLKAMNNFPVALPPQQEQGRIVLKVDALMALCDTLKTHINTAQTTQLQLADAMSDQAVA